MQLTCLYHSTHKMKVTDDEDEYNNLIASGLWFDHPSKVNEKGINHEKQGLHVKKRKRERHSE